MSHPALVRLMVVLMALMAIACSPVVARPGPAVAAPTIADAGLIGRDGAKLPLRVWRPANGISPRAVIIALHGFNDYRNFFADAGTWFAERGIMSYAYDQRGFGAAPNRGLWPGGAALADDLRAAVEAARSRHPGIPLYLLGESMGAAVIITAMAGSEAPEVDGVILVSPAVWGRASMPWYQTTALWLAVHTLPGSQVTGRNLGIRPSDNIEMLRALGRDPMVIKGSRIDAVYGLVNLMDDAMAAAGSLRAPALILYGERDELIPPAAVREMVARLPAAAGKDLGPDVRQRVVAYANGYHMLTRDLQATVVLTDIAAWIDDRDAPLPSEDAR